MLYLICFALLSIRGATFRQYTIAAVLPLFSFMRFHILSYIPPSVISYHTLAHAHIHLRQSVPPIGRNGAHTLPKYDRPKNRFRNNIFKFIFIRVHTMLMYWIGTVEYLRDLFTMCLFTFDLFIWFCFSTSPLNTRIKYEKKAPIDRWGKECSTT